MLHLTEEYVRHLIVEHFNDPRYFTANDARGIQQ